jgi:ribosomal protein S18 acetylase RimI-like enzyme
VSIKLIPMMWETKKLTIQDITADQIERVQELYEQGSYIHQWDGSPQDNEYAYRCFTVGDLPPNGTKDNFKIQVIKLKDTERMVGILTTYHGYPYPEIFYINYLYIDKDYHQQGLGQEVVKELLTIIKQRNYDEVRANVAIKNWAALRFWSKLGLNTINGIYGDKELAPDHFADIELVKQL